MSFTHLDGDGNVSMVDVSSKPGTLRTARASGWILMRPETVGLLSDEGMPKGNVLTAAKVAAIQAAKWTAHIIPLCHQLNLSWVDVSFEVQVDRIAIFDDNPDEGGDGGGDGGADGGLCGCAYHLRYVQGC